MIYSAVQTLIDYALKNELIPADDIYVVRNRLMEALGLSDWEETAADCSGKSIDGRYARCGIFCTFRAF